ncbi:MAG TPA: hypothetical protein VLA34_03950 [Candidatus Krumholzibacterium sp.]|nr:hypothetical protein [Candidatus Krumholzibacterium sp.]
MKKALILVILLVTAGCSSYTMKMEVSRDLYYAGEYDDAIIALNELIEKSSGNDRHLYLAERGKMRLAAGRYDSAIVDLQEAERRFQEIEGTISLSELVKTSVMSAGSMEYQPWPHEKILINAYLLLAYWLSGDAEGAYVERNRVAGRLRQYTDQLSDEDWQKLDVPFARYLVGLLYEMEGLTDDARIEYDDVARIYPDARPPGEQPGLTEMIVFAEVGRAPVKVSREIKGYFNSDLGSRSGFFDLGGDAGPFMVPAGMISGFSPEEGVVFSFDFPEYVRQPRLTESCTVVVDSVEAAETILLDGIEETSMVSFKKDIGRILLKSAVRAYLQIAAQKKLEDKAGGIFNILAKGIAAAEKADTRSWQTLPSEIRVFRMEIEPGEHEMFLNYYDKAGVRVARSRCVAFTVEKGEKEIIYLPGPS